AGAQPEAADLRWRNVDVVRARQVVRLRRAQEAETVGQHFDDAFADDVDFLAGKLLGDGEHQLLLAHGAGVFDVLLLGKSEEFRRGFGFQVLKFHFPHAGNSYRGVAAAPKIRDAGASGRGEDAGLRAGLWD